uniref:E3 ubiquitin-protein ligase TRIM39-like n=1 Tax=Pygocentrus nattereri TaxID=42514 RepID=A0AAR2INU4_PYGNA
MASVSDFLSEDQFLCSICLDVLTDPVSTPCGHNFCKTCLTEHWRISQHWHCPFCKEKCVDPKFEMNTTLREAVDHFKRSGLDNPEVLCDVCIGVGLTALKSCLMCLTSYCKTHLYPHEQVPALKKHKLINPVKNLEDYICQKHERPLEMLCRVDQKYVCDFCINTDHKTHSTVPIEEEKKQAEELIKELEQEITKPTTLQQWRITHKTHSQALYIHQPIFGPSKSHPNLILSDDGKQVRHTCRQQNRPDDSQRFDTCCNVLGKEGFFSDRFYYEVQVRDKTDWVLGVSRESIKRKGVITLSPENGFWTVSLRKGNKYDANDITLVPLYLREKLQKVGVFVDYEQGLVSFYNVESRSHIYSFTGQSFTEKLYPFFSPGNNDGGKNSAPLIISLVSKN